METLRNCAAKLTFQQFICAHNLEDLRTSQISFVHLFQKLKYSFLILISPPAVDFKTSAYSTLRISRGITSTLSWGECQRILPFKILPNEKCVHVMMTDLNEYR